jgi:TetR/AcrR family transcriptional regulator, mexJK operon transcriptional repressor
VLEAALIEFAAGGFAGAALDAVARRAGLSPAELQRLFPEKDALFREVVRDALVENVVPEAPGMPGVPSADAEPAAPRLRRAVLNLWDALRRPVMAALFRLTLGELTQFPELALLHCTTVETRALRRLEAEIARGVQLGAVEPRAAARALAGAVMMQAFWANYPDYFVTLTGRDPERARDRTIDLFLRALAA